MIIPDPWRLAFLVTALLLLLGTTSGLVNSELWISEPLVCAVASILLRPVVLGFELWPASHHRPAVEPDTSVGHSPCSASLTASGAGPSVKNPRTNGT